MQHFINLMTAYRRSHFRVLVVARSILLMLCVILAAHPEQAQSLNIDSILNSLNKGNAEDRKVNADRENSFKRKQQERQSALSTIKRERVKQESLSNQLEQQFNSNEVAIVKLQEELKIELGDLKELFGVIQQTASEAQEEYKTSLISAQYPDRAATLQQMVAKMAGLTQLVSIDEIEELWFHLQNEMTEQGKIVRYDTAVYSAAADEAVDIEASGGGVVRKVTRIGSFGAVSGDDIAQYEHGRGLVLLDRQMDKAYRSASNELQNSTQGVTSFQLDPTKGALLSALVRKPSITEKVQEGKIIGYAILVLGAIAVVVALIRILMLVAVQGSIKKQMNISESSTKNPLGRLRAAFEENPNLAVESMELIAMEALQREVPKLNRGVMLIKIVAVVAPLLGLLGTVTGMIQTFQAITLFGAGDPQLMAGGISQALVTTVLGLVVAIPAVFLHWLASGRAQRIEDTLEEQAAAMLSLRQ